MPSLAAHRRRLNLTQAEAAELGHLSRKYVQAAEFGLGHGSSHVDHVEFPGQRVLVGLASANGLSVRGAAEAYAESAAAGDRQDFRGAEIPAERLSDLWADRDLSLHEVAQIVGVDAIDLEGIVQGQAWGRKQVLIRLAKALKRTRLAVMLAAWRCHHSRTQELLRQGILPSSRRVRPGWVI